MRIGAKTAVLALTLVVPAVCVEAAEMVERKCFQSTLMRDSRLPLQVTSDSENQRCLFWVTPPREMASDDPTYRASLDLSKAIQAEPGTAERQAQIVGNFSPNLATGIQVQLESEFLSSPRAKRFAALLREDRRSIDRCALGALEEGISKGSIGEVDYFCSFQNGDRPSFAMTLSHMSVSVDFETNSW